MSYEEWSRFLQCGAYVHVLTALTQVFRKPGRHIVTPNAIVCIIDGEALVLLR